ncbi:MAG: chitobiase/beta-hexosaminidase C-terminal domain-containing protein [Muribaculaceae bacterium]
MKKFLLTAAAIAIAATASADDFVTAFIAENGVKEGWDIEANDCIILPNGFYFQEFPVSNTSAKADKYIEQYVANKYVSITSGPVVAGDNAGKPNTSYVTNGALRWYANTPITFTPAKGVKITQISVRNQRNPDSGEAGKIHPDAEVDISIPGTTVQYLALNSTEPVTLVPTQQSRVFYIAVTTEGEPNEEQVAVPVVEADFFIDPAYKEELAFAGKTHILSADKYITLTTATEGATIYYTVDGSEPTTDSPKYTVPFRLDKDAVVKAVAVKEGMANSFAISHQVFIVSPGTQMYSFNFNYYPSLITEAGQTFGETEGDVPVGCNGFLYYNHGNDYSVASWYGNSRIQTPDLEIVNEPGGDLVLSLIGNANNVLERSGTYGFVVEYRSAPHEVHRGELGFLLDNDELYMTDIIFAASTLYCNRDGYTGRPYPMPGEPGEYKVAEFSGAYSTWRCGDAKVNEFNFNPNPSESSRNFNYDQIYVFSDKKVGGVSNIALDESNAPVEYYNLQGVRVANPENGLYIRRQGSKATKVIMK